MPCVRIAFATTTSDVLKGSDTDRAFHEAAFAAADVALDHCIWWDHTTPWHEYDLVVIRSPWDYVERFQEFHRWLQRVEALGTLRNPAPIVAWNLDKSYLAELEAEGLAIVPTRFASTEGAIVEELTSGAGEVVVKPAISAGSRNTGRFARDDPHAFALAARILAGGTPVMIQPCIASVAASGETSAVLFNGEISHALQKGPILAPGGGYLEGEYREEVMPALLTDQQEKIVRESAEIIARIAEERFRIHSPLLYARVDLVTLDDGRAAVLEVELAEPTFFLDLDPDAPGRFVTAVTEHVRMADQK
jgi:glutathione synthase/RimK-type ligase-like ATP-grasp enzyme